MEKVWSKPKLIVLLRGRPEEGVLRICKDSWTVITDANTVQTACSGPNEATGGGDPYCPDCDGYSAT